jgi:hypothetical protein
MPALIMLRRISGELLEGPSVAIIFVLRVKFSTIKEFNQYTQTTLDLWDVRESNP